MQLVSYGVEDLYLTGNPMITYFKAVYRRHTNFATEVIKQRFSDTPDFGRSVSAVIARNGDLLSNLFLSIEVPELRAKNLTRVNKWVDNLGHYLVDYVEVELGGMVIDRHNGDWLEIWSQLTMTTEQRQGYLEMIGNGRLDALGRPTGLQKDRNSSFIPSEVIYVPLQFWFCRNFGLALPLIAMQYHEVKVNLELAPLNRVTRTAGVALNPTSLNNVTLWAEYVYLDTEERNRFKNSRHEYLIEQVQYQENTVYTSNDRQAPSTSEVTILFQHPVKELIWVVQPLEFLEGDDVQLNNYTSVMAQPPMTQTAVNLIDDLGVNGLAAINTSHRFNDITQQSTVCPSGALNPVTSATITVNGNRRLEEQPGTYFNQYQPYRYHTAVPPSPGINVYSFALEPEQHQPSGSINMSMLENATLHLHLAHLQEATPNPNYQYPGLGTINPILSNQCVCKLYGINYNVLRIMNGLSGIAYQS